MCVAGCCKTNYKYIQITKLITNNDNTISADEGIKLYYYKELKLA